MVFENFVPNQKSLIVSDLTVFLRGVTYCWQRFRVLQHGRLAFTLAEVLITIGIIGVVAALTLPVVINKCQSKVLETRYKKSISTINQLVLKSKQDLGVDLFTQYCSGSAIDSCVQTLNNNLILKGNKALNNSNLYNIERTDKIATYNNAQVVTNSAMGQLIQPVRYTNALPDGSFFWDTIVENWSGQAFYNYVVFAVDTNGYKRPNKLGHDIFIFLLNPQNDTLQTRYNYSITYTQEEIDNNYNSEVEKERAGNPCSINSNQKGNGVGCSYYSLKNICPDDNTKTYFECLP